jgi:hypothetical protein
LVKAAVLVKTPPDYPLQSCEDDRIGGCRSLHQTPPGRVPMDADKPRKWMRCTERFGLPHGFQGHPHRFGFEKNFGSHNNSVLSTM